MEFNSGLKGLKKYGVRIRTGFIWLCIALNAVINFPRFEKGIEFPGQTNDARLLKYGVRIRTGFTWLSIAFNAVINLPLSNRAWNFLARRKTLVFSNMV